MTDMVKGNWRAGLGVGVHYDFHARAEDQELGVGLVAEDLVETWKKIRPDWVQCDMKGVQGYASYPSEFGPRPEALHGDPLRVWRDASRQLDLPLVAHYCSLLEAAASKRADWVRIDAQDRPTGSVCVTSTYRDEQMIPQLLEVIDRYDVDGVWIDADAWSVAPCYCERCKGRYLENTAAAAVPRSEADDGWHAWLAFHRDAYLEHARAVGDAVHARKSGCLYTVNWAYSLNQPEAIDLPVDTLSGDLAYNHTLDWHECEARFLDMRGRPWDLQEWCFTHGFTSDIEMRGIEHLCQAGAVTLAGGGAAVYYLQPLRTGALVGWQNDALAEVVAFCRDRAPHCIGTESVPHVAVLHCSESHYATAETIGAEVALYMSVERTANIKGAVLSLLDLQYHVDVINEVMLEAADRNYAMIVVPEPRALNPQTLAALTAYVERGGRLLLSGAEVTELAPDLTGLRAGGAIEAEFRWVEVGARVSGLPGPWRQTESTGAKIVRTQLRHQEPSSAATPYAAIALHEVGQGLVATIPAPIFTTSWTNRLRWRREIVNVACHALAPEMPVTVTAGPSIHFTHRRRGNTEYVHLINTAADPSLSPRKLDIERVPESGPVTMEIELPSPPTTVRVEPSGTCEFEWRDGRARITVPSVHIHSIIAIDL